MPCPTDLPKALCDLRPALLRLARQLTGSREQAQDICQEVLLRLWSRLQNGQDIDNLQAYAMAAVRNQYRQHLRDALPEEALNDADEPVAPIVFATLALHEIETVISQLPEPQARLIRLVAEGETSPLRLAEITGWPVGTVMSRLARARARLRAGVGLGENSPTADLF